MTNIDIINKFADDTKLGHRVLCQSDQTCLQNSLNSLCEWAKKWGMQFNENKCKVIHFGKGNPNYSYTMNNVQLSEVDEEKDVGIKIQSTLKPTKHCREIVQRANYILNQLVRSFHYRDRHTFIRLYKTYVRCHLEYCTPAWSPATQGDINLIENVQRRAVRMVSGLQSDSYEDRLKEIGLRTLEARRDRFDMIQAFKIIHRVDDVDPGTWFQHVDVNRPNLTRSTACPLNLLNRRTNTSVRENFFSVRIVKKWNSLPECLKNSATVHGFKKLYDRLI